MWWITTTKAGNQSENRYFRFVCSFYWKTVSDWFQAGAKRCRSASSGFSFALSVRLIVFTSAELATFGEYCVFILWWPQACARRTGGQGRSKRGGNNGQLGSITTRFNSIARRRILGSVTTFPWSLLTDYKALCTILYLAQAVGSYCYWGAKELFAPHTRRLRSMKSGDPCYYNVKLSTTDAHIQWEENFLRVDSTKFLRSPTSVSIKQQNCTCDKFHISPCFYGSISWSRSHKRKWKTQSETLVSI